MIESRKSWKLALLGIVLVAIPLSVYLVKAAGSTQVGVKAGRQEEVLLFMMPAEIVLSRGEMLDISLKIDTGQETVGGMKVFINYDSDLLSLVSAAQTGSAFPEMVIGEDEGQLVLTGEGQLLGRGTVATLSFMATEMGKTIVEIGESSLVWDEAKKSNIIGNTGGAVVLIR